MPYGFSDQEASQAHAEEEAQEDAPPHAASASPQVTRLGFNGRRAHDQRVG